ncbi:Protein DSBN-1 a [Aphelenchoides avenae]|nr:Protein DSBN-1 a [Aphelenchus avenae]
MPFVRTKDPSSSEYVERLSNEFYDWLGAHEFGEDLLSRYKLDLFQVKEVNRENVRLANMASTRMSAVQQSLNERWEAVGSLHDRLAQLPATTKALDDVAKQLAELTRFSMQMELSMACLEAVCGLPGSDDGAPPDPKTNDDLVQF